MPDLTLYREDRLCCKESQLDRNVADDRCSTVRPQNGALPPPFPLGRPAWRTCKVDRPTRAPKLDSEELLALKQRPSDYLAKPDGITVSCCLTEELQRFRHVVVGLVLPGYVETGGPVLAVLGQLGGPIQVAEVTVKPDQRQVIAGTGVMLEGGIHLAATLQVLRPPAKSVTAGKELNSVINLFGE